MSRSKRRRAQQRQPPRLAAGSECRCTLRGAACARALEAARPTCAEHDALRFHSQQESHSGPIVLLDGVQVMWAVEWLCGAAGWVLSTLATDLPRTAARDNGPTGLIRCCPCHESPLLRLQYGVVEVLGGNRADAQTDA